MRSTGAHRQRLEKFRQLKRQATKNSFGYSFRDSERLQEIRNRLRKTPRYLKVLQTIYHKYGLKHVLLLGILVVYAFFGAGLFYLLETSAAENKFDEWYHKLSNNRSRMVQSLIPKLFNNSELLLFLDGDQSHRIYNIVETQVHQYEHDIGVKYTDQKIEWDFWNAMLYAGTVCTTIGYGHLYPISPGGKVATIIYAIFGIPLVLSILDDLGRLLTVTLKYPWLLVKMFCRRAFRYCTKQTMEEICRLDDIDKEGLAIFDLPIPVAIGIVFSWICICSATFCIWEETWDYFTAFYFFFISLSTIGLGDITPQHPKFLLIGFGFVIVGLSLVSMCVNLIQAKLEKTYEAGKEDVNLEAMVSQQEKKISDANAALLPTLNDPLARKHRTTMGVLQTNSNYSLASSRIESPARHKKVSKLTQTILSFPSPRKFSAPNISNGGAAGVFPTSLSIDDVMRLVDTEEGDITILSSLVMGPKIELTSMSNFNTQDDISRHSSDNDIAQRRSVPVKVQIIREPVEITDADTIRHATGDQDTLQLIESPSDGQNLKPSKSEPSQFRSRRLTMFSTPSVPAIPNPFRKLSTLLAAKTAFRPQRQQLLPRKTKSVSSTLDVPEISTTSAQATSPQPASRRFSAAFHRGTRGAAASSVTKPLGSLEETPPGRSSTSAQAETDEMAELLIPPKDLPDSDQP